MGKGETWHPCSNPQVSERTDLERPGSQKLQSVQPCAEMEHVNRLYYGDNLMIMRERIPSNSVDLIYLDPPFKSDQNYNLIYRTLTGKPVPEQAEAFCDTWDMDAEKAELAKRIPQMMRDTGVEDYYIHFWQLWVNALQDVQPHLLAYLIYMVERLIFMKPILKNTGSIYLHCDPTASHYIKVMMDGIFGHQNFRNEIIWRRTGSHNSARRFGPVHDVILFYTKSDKYTWNVQKRPYMQGHVDMHFKKNEDGTYRTNYSGNVISGSGRRGGESGRPWKGFDPDAKGRHWAIPGRAIKELGLVETFKGWSVHQKLDYLLEHGHISIVQGEEWPRFAQWNISSKDGQPLSDIWSYQPYTEGTLFASELGIDDDIRWMGTSDGDRLGYQTQKPVGLLTRIINSSSRPGDLVFDPFCGCGTTVYAAQETARRWIGCDIAILSIRLIREVLTEKYRLVENKDFDVDGIPVGVEQAEELFKRDAHQFQHWVVERVGGFPLRKKGADKGIDGRLYFEAGKGLKCMVLSVKGGNTGPADVRDLEGVLSHEQDTELAGFITLHEPTRAMHAAAAKAGTFTYQDVEYPRLQILSVREVLEDKKEFRSPSKIGSRIATGQTSLPL